MKLTRITLVFFAVMLTFGSCKEMHENYQISSKHRKAIRTELGKYTDVLDLRRSEISPYGIGYSLGSAIPSISIGLYVKPTRYNRETLTELATKLADFFNNDFLVDNEMIMKWEGRFTISIYFVLIEGKKHYYQYQVMYGGGEWREEWHETPFLYR
ncbi:MAG: hypothetical protein LBH44_04500 [Treponema sp.]|jgi:hypothetical protein|nr:hypothetical protein [Treponema sp.]